MWRNDNYIYTSGILKGIATSYHHIYQRIEWYTKARNEPIVIDDPLALVEYKVDFDCALNEIGRGTWVGGERLGEFGDYRYFSKFQRLIIADILGVLLEDTRINYAEQLQGRAYGKLCWLLNEPNDLSFIAKPLDKGVYDKGMNIVQKPTSRA